MLKRITDLRESLRLNLTTCFVNAVSKTEGDAGGKLRD